MYLAIREKFDKQGIACRVAVVVGREHCLHVVIKFRTAVLQDGRIIVL